MTRVCFLHSTTYRNINIVQLHTSEKKWCTNDVITHIFIYLQYAEFFFKKRNIADVAFHNVFLKFEGKSNDSGNKQLFFFFIAHFIWKSYWAHYCYTIGTRKDIYLNEADIIHRRPSIFPYSPLTKVSSSARILLPNDTTVGKCIFDKMLSIAAHFTHWKQWIMMFMSGRISRVQCIEMSCIKIEYMRWT